MMVLAIDQICLDFQSHKNLIEPVVEEIVEQMRRGKRIEPVVVCFDGARYFLQDGFHRVEAARRLRRRKISAEVMPGTLEEMQDEWRQMMKAAMRKLRQEEHEAAAAKSAPRRKRSRQGLRRKRAGVASRAKRKGGNRKPPRP